MSDAIGIESVEKVVQNEYKTGSHYAYVNVWIVSTARDSGNTPTTTLRPGLVLGEISATGKYAEYDDSATDGTQTAKLILDEQIDLINEETNAAQDTQAHCVWHGRVSSGALIGIDPNGKTDLAGYFFFDD